MPTETRTHRRYDHRFRELIRRTGDIDLALQHGVPRSTARGWLTSSNVAVVSIDACDMDVERLRCQVVMLRRRIARLIAVLRVLIVVLRICGEPVNRARIPEGKDKRLLLQAIARSRGVLPAAPVRTEVQEILRAFQRKDELGASPACRRRLDFPNPASGESCFGRN